MDRKECDNRPERRLARLSWLSVLFSVLTAGAVQAEQVRMWPRATVTAAVVRLGDVAALSGFDESVRRTLAESVLIPAPPSGRHVVIAATDVRDHLRRTAINMATVNVCGAADCLVQRPTDVPPPSGADASASASNTLAAQIRERLQAVLAGLGGTLSVTYDPADQAVLDLAGPTYRFVMSAPARQLGDVMLQVDIHRDGQAVQRRALRVRLELERPVVVTRRDIDRGAIIQPTDVLRVPRRFSDTRELGIGAVSDIVGQETRRRIEVGEMVVLEDLRSMPLVDRNKLVAVQSTVDGIVIEGTGTALETGHLGEIIQVRNERSGAVFAARVTGRRNVSPVTAGAAVADRNHRKGDNG